MAKRRPKFLETRYFGLVIGLFVVGLFLVFDALTGVPERLETRVLDAHFNLREGPLTQTVQEGVTVEQRNPDISSDLLIVGVDQNSLARFGRWPWPRYRHADLTKSFSRISDQTQRERALWFDFFFVERADDAYSDAVMRASFQENGRVFLETALQYEPPAPGLGEELFDRHETLFDAAGRITNVSGDWTAMPSFFGLEPPLQPLAETVAGYGHATFIADYDGRFRRQPMIAKSTELLEEFPLEELSADTPVDFENYERLVWFDRDGVEHTVEYPLTETVVADLRSEMQRNAPVRVEDTNNDGEADREYYVVRRYRDHFMPAITLSLALEYFNKGFDDIEVILGEHIRIPDPEYFDTEVGEWVPYRILERPAVFAEDGTVTEEAVYREPPEITIPIDQNGFMLINFMGRPSSADPGGNQTFPVRSFAGYASRIPGPDPQSWPRTRAVDNDIVMVGIFATGAATDEKTTPFGIMYGVELHANALNTIIMDKFIHESPAWVDALVLFGIVMLVAFLASRFSTIWAMVASMLMIVAYFIVTTLIFESNDYLLNFSTPAIAIIFTFIAVVVYRAMTEEAEKRQVRNMFGRYVSPTIVDQILENPPELGGVDKDLTVFFSDIRGFTTLSERMSPQELVTHLNVYLTAMTDIILEFGGTLDKYVGDEIMCFWGAPLPQEDHAFLACKCALRQMEKLNELNEQWPEDKRINIGIGINSGIMTVGNMGSSGRMNYTAMGDNVNIGARLEGVNKQFSTNIIMSEYTYGLVEDRVIARELDNITVKGKNRPLVIYELIDIPDGLEPPRELSKAAAKAGA